MPDTRLLLILGVLTTLVSVTAMGTLPDGNTGTDPVLPDSQDAELPLVIPESDSRRTNPLPDTEEVLARGKILFLSQCGMCHGQGGGGDGDLAHSLAMTVPDFRSPGLQAQRTDGDLFYIMSHGHGRMPAEERMSDESKWTVVHTIRSLEAPSAN